MSRRKYMIRCDIEGVTGVVSYKQAEPGQAEYAFGQRMFMADLTACLDGLLAGGAEEIVIYDEHYYGCNIDLDVLPESVTVICGKPPYRADWAGGLDSSFSGVILLGFHSKYGTSGGVLPHSYELDIGDLRLNGVSVGEIGMEAAIAGDCGVPVLMTTSDSAGVAEAQALLPNVCGVVVKESLSETGGLCYPVAVTTKRIHSAAEAIVKESPGVSPYKVGSDVTLEVELNDGLYLDTVRRKLDTEMKGNHILVLQATSATAAWADYWQKKLYCQKTIDEITS